MNYKCFLHKLRQEVKFYENRHSHLHQLERELCQQLFHHKMIVHLMKLKIVLEILKLEIYSFTIFVSACKTSLVSVS